MVYGLEADVSYADISGEIWGVDVSIDWMTTVRGRLGFLLTPNVLAYGTAGYGWVGASASVPGFSISETESDFVFGAGLEAKLSPTSSLRVEYLTFGDLEVDVVRAGLSFKLGN
jgi:outer membrane immunogenic protein